MSAQRKGKPIHKTAIYTPKGSVTGTYVRIMARSYPYFMVRKFRMTPFVAHESEITFPTVLPYP